MLAADGVMLTIYSCRRNLMKMICIGEFSASAIFQNPCLSFVLPDVSLVTKFAVSEIIVFISQVICTFCNSCRDLDLCQDQNVSVTEDAGTR